MRRAGRAVGKPMVRFGTVETEVVLKAVLTVEAFLLRSLRFPASTRNPSGREVHRVIRECRRQRG
jgi:hypothetical protein